MPSHLAQPEFSAHRRLCYYPSCNHETPWILMRLDCDLYVMSDKSPAATRWSSFEHHFRKHRLPIEKVADTNDYLHFKSGDKTVWVFREDNRSTLARIAAQGLQIHHFVGICDGCAEGGNQECVHERPFMSHLLPLAADGMQYTTDHSAPLQNINPYTWQRKFQEHQYWGNFPEPSDSGRASNSDADLSPDIAFELQGILYRDGDRQQVLSFGTHPCELTRLSPFRTMFNRPILAEYRVWRASHEAERLHAQVLEEFRLHMQ